MTRPGRARRAIGFGLLVPGLLFVHPAGISAETKPRPTAKRAAAKDHGEGVKTAGAEADRCVHVVRRGESLTRIASQYHVTRQSIIDANHLTRPDALKAGQRLNVGCKAAASPRRLARRDEPIVPSDPTMPLVARVGPRRIPTRLYMDPPDWSGEGIEFDWPVDGPIASGFGRRARGWHAGVDIVAEMGTPIHAAAAGTVVWSGWEATYGHMIRLQHAGGFTSIYAHNLENLVEIGDRVEAGAVIATVGKTGRASSYHLHFEIRRDGMAYNPLYVLEPRDAPVLASAAGAPLDGDEDRE